MKEKTGIDYEIHIISEAAANGSILSLESDMILHDRSDETNDLHLPMANVSDLFKYHYMPNSKVGYMVNYPSDLSGKMANFESFFFIRPSLSQHLKITCPKIFCLSHSPSNGLDQFCVACVMPEMAIVIRVSGGLHACRLIRVRN